MKRLLALSSLIDRLNEGIGRLVMWGVLLTTLVATGNALAKHFLGQGSNAWLEAQWYLFGALFLLGTGYTLMHNGHVRIDVFYQRLSPKARAWIDLLGGVLFLLPFAGLLAWLSRRTLSSAEQLHAVIRCRDAAESLGHSAEFLFPVDIKKIPQMDAVFIRARTDPLNVTYIASRMAESCGIPVIDDPASIRICSDKVNMYSHLLRKGIAIPETLFLSREDASLSRVEEIFSRLGCPLILKEPSTSFTLRVEKVTDPDQFMKVASRFFRMSDWIVVQEFVESRYDWRVGVLDGELLYVCK